MSNFIRVKPTGYTLNSKVTSAELTQLDIDHAKAINGDEGSTHTPANPVVINGAGIETTDLTTTGKTTLSGDGAGIACRVGALGDADATVDTTKDVYIASTLATADRTITLNDSSSPVPQLGEVIRFANHISTGVGTFDWIFQREDSTELGRIKETVNNALGAIAFVFTVNGWEGFECGGSGIFTDH